MWLVVSVLVWVIEHSCPCKVPSVLISVFAGTTLKMSFLPCHLVALRVETCTAERVSLCCCDTHPVCMFGMGHTGEEVGSSWPSPTALAQVVKGSALLLCKVIRLSKCAGRADVSPSVSEQKWQI